jgi:hypothetical protein
VSGRWKALRLAALLFALFTIIISVGGFLFPDAFMTVRRSYYATPGRFYTVGAIRVAMGLVLIMAGSISRWPRILRALGVVVCLQGFVATLFFGLERARAVMEWEAMQGTALLRVGAVAALAGGSFVAFAVAKRAPEEQRKVAH